MKIKLKNNQPREILIFNVSELADAYECELADAIVDYMKDIVVATAQNNHEELVQALNGLKGAIANQELNELSKVTHRLLGLVDMEGGVI